MHLKRFKTNTEAKTVDKLFNAVKIEKELNIGTSLPPDTGPFNLGSPHHLADFACNRYTFNPQKATEYKPETPSQQEAAQTEKGKEKPSAKTVQKATADTPKSRQLTIEETRTKRIVIRPDDDLEDIISEAATPQDRRRSYAEIYKEQQKQRGAVTSSSARDVFAFDSQTNSPGTEKLNRAMQMSLKSFEEEEIQRKEQEQLDLALAQSMKETDESWDVPMEESVGEKRKRSPEPHVNGVVSTDGPAASPKRPAKRKHREEKEKGESAATSTGEASKGTEGGFNSLERSPRQTTVLFSDSGDEPVEPDEPYDARYALRCIVSHRGKAAAAGHYVADVFDAVAQKWENFNDAHVMDVRYHQSNASTHVKHNQF